LRHPLQDRSQLAFQRGLEARQSFHLAIRCLAALLCLLFMLNMSFESYEASASVQGRFEETFDRASGQQTGQATFK
jgi:hypothetical protein